VPSAGAERVSQSRRMACARSSLRRTWRQSRILASTRYPELSFRSMGGRPLAHPKKTWAGVMMRRRLLESAGVCPPDEPGVAVDMPPDDVADAAVAAWSAHRIALGTARALQIRQADCIASGVEGTNAEPRWHAGAGWSAAAVKARLFARRGQGSAVWDVLVRDGDREVPVRDQPVILADRGNHCESA
jgi:hypothetical protein